MGQTSEKIFQKRFGSRISIVFSEKIVQPAEMKVQNIALYKAVKQVMAGILKRDPTSDEIVGLEDISKCKHRR